MNQKAIVALILGVLVVISVVQAIQLNNLKNKIQEGQVSLAGIPRAGSTGGKIASPPPANNLPQMVGGC